MNTKLYGALEAGGTKMVLGIADADGRILRSHSLPTRTPNETVPEMIAFFSQHAICALGVATFGPAQVHADSPEYGAILHTPKLAWQGYPLCQTLSRALNVPFACDTDVNAAALAEVRLGAARGLHSCLYLTIGTGIGGGLYCEDRLVHGILHPEWGHMLLAPRADDPTPEGFCPFHQHCAEGLAAGPAMEKRWGVSARDLPADHPAFDLEAYYLAQVCVNALMTVSPERILLGGGVMQREGLLPRVRQYVRQLQNGYITAPELNDLDAYLQTPALYPLSGLVGAALLALSAR